MPRAQCCCGSLTIGVAGEPVLNAVCHCTNCKRRTGSGFGWQCYFPESAVTAPSGEAGVYEFVSQSGA